MANLRDNGSKRGVQREPRLETVVTWDKHASTTVKENVIILEAWHLAEAEAEAFDRRCNNREITDGDTVSEGKEETGRGERNCGVRGGNHPHLEAVQVCHTLEGRTDHPPTRTLSDATDSTV